MAAYGLIGRSLKHSFSKKYFTEKFSREGIDSTYELFELDKIEDFLGLREAHPELKGLNVTIPYKSAIIPYLDACDPEAEAIGAVNTLKFESGKVTGYNTDHTAFMASLRPFLAHGMERALILGSGGAARAVAYALRKFGISAHFVSRNPSGPDQLGYDALNEHVMRAFLIIVNTTPLGTYPDVENRPALPYQYLTPNHLLYDLVYNPGETAFLKAGKKQGAITTNGLSMLGQQAEGSWKIWNLQGK